MAPDSNRKSTGLHVVAAVLIGLGVLVLWLAERLTTPDDKSFGPLSSDHGQKVHVDAHGNAARDGLLVSIGVIFCFVFGTPMVLGIAVDTALVEAVGSQFGALLFGSDDYAIVIEPRSYTASLFVATVFGTGWALRKQLVSGESESEILVRIFTGIFCAVSFTLVVAVLFYRFLIGPPTPTELAYIDRLGVTPGELFRSISVLTLSSLLVLSFESYFDAA